MAALQDQWHADRLKRQQAVAERRQAVKSQLDNCQQVRQHNATEQREALTAHYEELKSETNLYLTQVQQQRQAQAQQTATKLEAFGAELQETVAELRTTNQQKMQQTQQYVAELQAVTQEELAANQRSRIAKRKHQEQKLTSYVDDLEASVAAYLDDISATRQTKAVQEHTQRQRDRAALTDEVEALREDYAVYRQEMQEFRADLRQSVWGDTPSPTSKNGSKASSNGHSPNVKSTSPAAAKPKAKPTSGKVSVSVEDAIFKYLTSQSDGARLTEIESFLKINRFQAVDALRSLIQQELIVQKDRTYRIREEVAL
ncbi:MAG: hypothetical protein AAGH78_02635 [Cyanobacteria bacterium P01_H01_bin.58]